MEEKRTRIIEKLKNDDIKQGIKTWIVVHTNYGGYTEEELEIQLGNDDVLIIRDGNNWIYLSEEQKNILIDFLIGPNKSMTID